LGILIFRILNFSVLMPALFVLEIPVVFLLCGGELGALRTVFLAVTGLLYQNTAVGAANVWFSFI